MDLKADAPEKKRVLNHGKTTADLSSLAPLQGTIVKSAPVKKPSVEGVGGLVHLNNQLMNRANNRKNNRSILRLKINKSISVKEAIDLTLRN